MSTVDKLNTILETKSNIAEAIGNKGVEVPASTPFSGYAGMISQISTGLNSEQVQGMIDASLEGIKDYENIVLVQTNKTTSVTLDAIFDQSPSNLLYPYLLFDSSITSQKQFNDIYATNVFMQTTSNSLNDTYHRCIKSNGMLFTIAKPNSTLFYSVDNGVNQSIATIDVLGSVSFSRYTPFDLTSKIGIVCSSSTSVKLCINPITNPTSWALETLPLGTYNVTIGGNYAYALKDSSNTVYRWDLDKTKKTITLPIVTHFIKASPHVIITWDTGSNNLLYVSTDDGNTWYCVEMPYKCTALNSIEVSSNIIIINGGNGMFAYSKDFGFSWKNTQLPFDVRSNIAFRYATKELKIFPYTSMFNISNGDGTQSTGSYCLGAIKFK